MLTEILYVPRDPFSRKVTVGKGSSNGIKAGQIVMDDLGVIGQVTRTYPWTAEVALITDKTIWFLYKLSVTVYAQSFQVRAEMVSWSCVFIHQYRYSRG